MFLTRVDLFAGIEGHASADAKGLGGVPLGRAGAGREGGLSLNLTFVLTLTSNFTVAAEVAAKLGVALVLRVLGLRHADRLEVILEVILEVTVLGAEVEVTGLLGQEAAIVVSVLTSEGLACLRGAVSFEAG